jgi:F0F1-type ATP synthase delta subunit
MYATVLSQIRTKEELEVLLGEIELLKQSLYETKTGNFEEVISQKIRKAIGEAILAELQKEKIDKEAYLEGLIKESKKLKYLKLTLAFEPTEKTVSRISEWLRTNVGQGILLDIEEDRSILGGAILAYRGEYKDFSLKALIDKYFEENKENILNLVKRGE